VSFSISGTPSAKKITWEPDSFNLVGFHVDSDAAPTFKNFFAPSTAHNNQAAFFLNSQGVWEFIDRPSTFSVQHGIAYWMWCKGASTFQGPLKIDLPMGAELDYGAVLTEQNLTIHNLANSPRTVSLKLSENSPAFNENLLVYRYYDKDTGYYTWSTLGKSLDLELISGKQAVVKLAVRRDQMGSEDSLAESILEISDHNGLFLKVPVSVEKVGEI